MKTAEFLDVLCDALNRDHGSVTLDDTQKTLEEWDSVGHLSIIATIDSALGVSPDEAELRDFTSIRQLVDVLKRKGALED
jgi:acyl carrier protein